MAVRLEIDNADNRGRVDYTRYIVSPEQSSVVLRDRVNMPALLDFALAPADANFVAPRRSAYVRLTGLADALPPGGPRVPGALFTGYITNEPAMEFLGVKSGGPVYGYRYQATSEEYLLNVKRIGALPPFLNRTAGQILKLLAERLQPGRFDTSAVADGALIPSYTPGADAAWSDVARDLAERSGFVYRVLDGKIYFASVASQPAGVAVDEHDPDYCAGALEVTPLGNPIQNDVTVYGGIEPQAYVCEHFVGDGYTSRFSLSFPVYGAQSSRLLADDFTAAVIDSGRWQLIGSGASIQIFQGALNITGGTGKLGETSLLARQSIELAGELELIHGEYEFVAASTGILGGLYSSTALALADCLAGFDASPIGNTTRLRAVIEGAVQAAELRVQAGCHYVLVTRLSADRAHRAQQTFPGANASYGGTSQAANVTLRLEAREISVANPSAQSVTLLYEGTLATLPPFAFYAPVNSTDLHCAANFLQITQPIQASLETQLPGSTTRARTLGFGIAGQDATITTDSEQNQCALEFYADTIPQRGEKITLRYRAAGRSRGRVHDAASVAGEAALAGDDGVRAAILSETSPPPRTSAEAELAAQAYLSDRVLPRYEGRYTTWSDFTDGFPRSGCLLDVCDESRYPRFTALVRGVTSEFRELAAERIQHTLEFGQPSRFEDLLRRFVPLEKILAPQEDLSLPAIDSAAVGTSFLADVPGPSLASTSGTQFSVSMPSPPPAGGSYEVRRSDQGWRAAGVPGTAQNLVSNFSAQPFVLPRGARNHAYFIRPVDASGRTSRFSSVLAVHYPLPPAAPQSLSVRFETDARGLSVIAAEIKLDLARIADVDRVELRASDNVTVLARWEFGQLREEAGMLLADFRLDNSSAAARSATFFAYTQNALQEYSPAANASASKPEPAKPFLSAGNSVGQVVELLLDRAPEEIVETQIQVVPPGGSFAAPAQDALLRGQPDKFNFVATQSGSWEFRARRRDAIGWSPWSNEPQGQLSAQTMLFAVHFFQAHELDPSIGAAVNPQNLLANSEFFLYGIAGQEGTHSARYFALVNAAAGGSEVEHLSGTNEFEWKAGVNFASASPGFRSLISNLGRLLNPGEPVSVSAALRHSAGGTFAYAVRFVLRSPSTPAYSLSSDVPAGTIGGSYQWCTATFTLPANQAVPADLCVELAVVIATGNSLASALYCDKVILNRGHRPAAFSLAPWDVVALAWNAAAGAYDLPATLVAATPRGSDPGNAGLLAGTGTEDLDPNFRSRFFRMIV